MRTNFRPLEFADALARHKELYEAAYPDSKKGAKGLIAMNTPDDKKPERQNVALEGTVQNFSENVAQKFGVGPRTIQRALWLAGTINRNAVQTLKACGIRKDAEHKILDNASQLRTLAKFPPEDQERIASHLAEYPDTCKTVADAWAKVDGHAVPMPAIKSHSVMMGG